MLAAKEQTLWLTICFVPRRARGRMRLLSELVQQFEADQAAK